MSIKFEIKPPVNIEENKDIVTPVRLTLGTSENLRLEVQLPNGSWTNILWLDTTDGTLRRRSRYDEREQKQLRVLGLNIEDNNGRIVVK